MSGSRGPVPKPQAQRRRRNRPEVPVDTAPAGGSPVHAPQSDPLWHPIAAEWFSSLATSGQVAFFEPSDWAVARLVAQGMHELLTGDKMSAVLFQSVLAGTTQLMSTEADRRRLRVELARGVQVDEDEVAADATVTDLRSRLGG